MLKTKNNNRKILLSSAAALILGSLIYAPLSNAVVPNDNQTPEDIVDNDGGVNGVGMFFRSDGSVCTGTLINPRTVLFAAHCVNNRPESDYGTAVRSAFSFNVDALPGFQNWFSNGFASNPDLNVFNINQIFYHPDSLTNAGAFGFLEADIALASLDTPAANIPTWALLFSRLPDPEVQDPTTGTGYHVNITGYGRSGSGTFGDTQGIDWRRRAAENMLGALTSFDDRNTFIFGAAFGDLPQNLYRLDFDDPNQTNPFDFNLYQDEPLAGEGTTAGGDSGGPLVLDAANNSLADEDLIIGVLSGGSRFFGGQVFSSYGTESFYQPLYLFADYIAETNPYRYVSALEGNGAWEDASHWQTDVDPNYRVIDANGNVVNGFPDVEPAGITETDDDGFGVVCFDRQGANPGDGCQNLGNGDAVPPSRETAAGPAYNNAGQLSDEELLALGLSPELIAEMQSDGDESENSAEQSISAPRSIELVENERQAPGDPLPAPTIDNGLAGATDFVPDNIDPPSGVNGTRRYFDVRLENTGTTTLSSAVTIDRLSVFGSAGLAVDSAGNLTSLIDITQNGGRIAVDGALNSVGDYTIFQGMLSGNGTVTAPFVTSINGTIAPGSLGTTGTLTIDGNAVLASGTDLLIDIGENGVSDLLAITGDSSLGGNIIFSPTSNVRAGNEYTFVTTAGSQSGEFTASRLSAILQPVISYTDNSVIATIEAGKYLDVIDSSNAVQSSYASLLDRGRGATGLDGIFAPLDLATVDQIQNVLDSWAPVTETTNQSLAKVTIDNLARFHRNRMSNFGSDDWGGGTVTVMGSPVQMAANGRFASALSDVGHLEASNGEPTRTTQSLPSDYAIYLAGSFIDGSGSAMPTAQNFEDEDFDGWSVSAGIERAVTDKVNLGASASYSQLEAQAALQSQAESDYLAATVYGQYRADNNFVLDGQFTLGSFGSQTTRNVTFPEATALTSDDDSRALTADVQVSRAFTKGKMVISPKASLRYTGINFGDVVEAGGAPALEIEREEFTSLQGRIGADLQTQTAANVKLRLSGEFVNRISSNNEGFVAGFAAGSANSGAPFALFGTDENWFEVGGGLTFAVGEAKVDLSAESTVGREDINAQSYRAGVTFKF